MVVDCHVHVVGPIAAYPQEEERTYTALPASVDELRSVSAPTPVDSYVVVQPSFYGADHRVLLESLERLGPRTRGVASADAADSPGELDRLVGNGVRGLRINRYSPLQSGGGTSLAEAIDHYGRIGAARALHLEVMAPLEVLLSAGAAIASCPAPVVLDHYGLYGSARPDDEGGRRLLELLARPHVFMKCSAPYRSGIDASAAEPDREWLAALVEVAPERCVWGSDWPFTPPRELHRGADATTPYRDLDYREVFAAFADALVAVGGDAALDAVLSSNAERLYDLEPTA